MNTLNSVIKRFNALIKESDNNLQKEYYKIIVRYLLIEHSHQEDVDACNKQIYHYFKYQLPVRGNDYFLFLYNTYNPVRFAVETFDSIESIRKELYS